MSYQRLSDRNFLKCTNCGKYKVDTDEEFKVLYKVDGSRSWLCETCNKFRKTFKESSSDLQLIIAPSKVEEEDCIIYRRDMYV